MRTLGRKGSVVLIFALLTACSQTSTKSSGTSSLDPKNQALVSFKLTDAPNKELKSVFVNIDHMEVVVAGKGKAGRLILAEGLGVVDLLTLQNGVTMNLQDIVAPQGISIQQIRLVLKGEGHYAVKSDDSVCELKTPSAEKTGVKIILTNKVEFEAGHEYSIVVDFDALSSVVVQGNGGCLLKPVLKLKSAFKKPIPVDHDDDEDDENNEKEETDQCLLAKNHSSSQHDGDDDDGDDEDSHSASNSINDDHDDHESNDDSDSEDSDDDSDDIVINPRPCPAPTSDPATNNTTTTDTTTTDTTTNSNTTTTTPPTDSSTTSSNTTSNTTTSTTTPTSPGVELVVNPDQNNTTSTDGWDYTPVVDGVTPVVTQDQLGTLL